MITQKTVFVLGAGASQPYGLPLGGGLFAQVVNDFTKNSPWRDLLLQHSVFTETDLEKFVGTLRRSGMSSVDAFLERRSEFMEIGKSMMAIALTRQERFDALWDAENGWMKYLYTRLSANTLEEFAANQVSFITYNYDRSLEAFLWESLINTFDVDVARVTAAITSIPIIHLHGHLGFFPWEKSKYGGRHYGQLIGHPSTLKMCVEQMKVVHEEIIDRDNEFIRAREELHSAERIYFMGFGFGRQNVARLELGKIQAVKKRVLATAYGLSSLEQQDIVRQCDDKVLLHNCQCIDFLRQYAVLA